jgi:uncharacterized coiled-coil DUF342 family protein
MVLADAATSSSIAALVILQAATLLGFIAREIINWLNKGRDQRWKIEERRLALEETKQAVQQNTKAVVQKIEENTGITKEAVVKADTAYNEANQHNRKFAEFKQELDAVMQRVDTIAAEVHSMSKRPECLQQVKAISAKLGLPEIPTDQSDAD